MAGIGSVCRRWTGGQSGCVLFVIGPCLSFQRLSKNYGDCFVPLVKPHLEELAVDSQVQLMVLEWVGEVGMYVHT